MKAAVQLIVSSSILLGASFLVMLAVSALVTPIQ